MTLSRVQFSDFDKGTWVDYSADGIQIVNDVTRIPFRHDYPLTLNLSIIVICTKGKMKVTTGEQECLVREGQVLFLQPNDTVLGHQFSQDLQAKALIFSPSVLEGNIYARRHIWDSISYLHLHPVQTLSPDSIRLLWHYYEIATANIDTADTDYKQEIVSHLLRSLVYEFLLLVERIAPDELAADGKKHQQQSGELHRRFVSLLAYSHGRMRKVADYADKLCVTPDQLTAAVKTVSGSTPIDWITESTVKVIKEELLYTSKPVKEIADELDFPSLSFFGKYLKQHTGLSPRQFRERNSGS